MLKFNRRIKVEFLSKFPKVKTELIRREVRTTDKESWMLVAYLASQTTWQEEKVLVLATLTQETESTRLPNLPMDFLATRLPMSRFQRKSF